MTGFERALRSLQAQGVDYRLRKSEGLELPVEGELDLWLGAGQVRRADSALRAAGFRYLKARGHPGHRFYVSCQGGQWMKLDAKVPGAPATAFSRARAAVVRRMPTSLRRLGPVVAVLGPDGAGKGSLIRGLRSRIPFGVSDVYLGMDKRRPKRMVEAGKPGSEAPAWREVAGLARRIVRTWRILLGAYGAAWRGHVVLCDRHPIEVLAVRPRRTPIGGRLERIAVQRLIPKPDAIVVLDAPGEVLFQRKGEHSVDVLERWRRGYLEVFGPKGAVTISTTGPRQASLRQASEVVWDALRKRRRW